MELSLEGQISYLGGDEGMIRLMKGINTKENGVIHWLGESVL